MFFWRFSRFSRFVGGFSSRAYMWSVARATLPKREVQTTGSDYSRTRLMGRVHRLQNGPCQAAKIRLHPVV